MSDQEKLLLETSPELCGECHASIVASARGETGHYPAAEDCLNCHLPHASAHTALLGAPKDELCGTCHDVEDEDLARTHLGADLSSLDCNDCHTPHGSDHGNLLATNLHAALEGGCETCHEGAYDRLMEDGEASLCLVCHEDVGEAAERSAVPHAALEVGRCTDCHNPHASAQASLIKLPSGGACIECHSDKGAGDGELLHGAIDTFGCEACHEPHGGSRPAMLRAAGDQLCLSCHDPRALEIPEDGSDVLLPGGFRLPVDRVREVASLRLSADGLTGHPIDNHRVTGTPTKAELKNVDTLFEGALSCLTCHDPHKGRSEKILRWEAASPMEACLACHPR